MTVPAADLLGAARRAPRYRFGYGATAFAYVALQAFTTVPSPLYGRYAARDGLSALMITLVYAAYAAGVAVSLLFAGHLSDTVGRRPVLLAALAINGVSAVVFIKWPDLPGLFLARVLCGVAVGVTASTATAYLNELFAAHRPPELVHRVRFLATATSIGGLGAGGLIGGIVAEFAPHPLVVPYLVALGLFVLAALGLTFAPETRVRPVPRPPYRPQRVSVPAHARGRYIAALTGVAAVFALFGLFVGLVGTVLAGPLHETSLALSGSVLFAVFGAGVVGSAVTIRTPPAPLLRVAVALMVVGPALLVTSVWLSTPSLALFVVAAVLIGAGGAALFRVSLGVASSLAPRERVAETLAGFFLAGYLGLSVPVIGIGLALQETSVRATLLGFAIVVVAGVLGILPGLARATRTA